MNSVLETAARLVGYANARRYCSRASFLFQGVPLRAASVLEVGCGEGAWAIWAALNGASKAVGIEPEGDGGRNGSLENFRRNIRSLGLQNRIEAYPVSLQDLPGYEGQFDIVVMYNVINHLDEEAVTALHKSERMAARYADLLRNLRKKLKFGGTAVVADCGRSNLWARLGIRSPFAPTIEWEKHQDPSEWIRIFEACDFRVQNCRWSPYYGIHRLSANPAFQYVTRSHFTLTFMAV